MIKKTISLAVVSIFMLLTCGCTQNNGNIGKLFGSWSLMELTEDGTVLSLPDGAQGAILSFQSNVVRFLLIFNPEDSRHCLATWSRIDDKLVLDFNNYSDDTPSGTGAFAPPYWLHMTELEETLLITRLDGGHLDMVLTSPEGKVLVYKYIRTW